MKKKKYRIVLNGLFTKKALVSISENGGGSAFREKWQKFRVVFYYFGARSISQLEGGGGGGDGKFAGKNFSNDSLVDPRMIRPERGEPSPGFQG